MGLLPLANCSIVYLCHCWGLLLGVCCGLGTPTLLLTNVRRGDSHRLCLHLPFICGCVLGSHCRVTLLLPLLSHLFVNQLGYFCSVLAGDDALQHEVLGDVLWYVILQVVGALKGSGCPLFHVGELQSLRLDPQTDDVGSLVKGFVWGEHLNLVVSQLEEGVLQQFLHCVSVREGQEA